jgi:hypothetical protein
MTYYQITGSLPATFSVILEAGTEQDALASVHGEINRDRITDLDTTNPTITSVEIFDPNQNVPQESD